MELKCGKTVPSRMYYLLDFNERDDWNYISKMFNVSKLKELDSEQFLELFYYATKSDMEMLKFLNGGENIRKLYTFANR